MLNLVREGEEDYIEAIRCRRRLKILENFLFIFWLARSSVITLALVLRHSVENRSKHQFLAKTNLYLEISHGYLPLCVWPDYGRTGPIIGVEQASVLRFELWTQIKRERHLFPIAWAFFSNSNKGMRPLLKINKQKVFLRFKAIWTGRQFYMWPQVNLVMLFNCFFLALPFLSLQSLEQNLDF